MPGSAQPCDKSQTSVDCGSRFAHLCRMTDDSATGTIVEVLLPLALDGAYSYGVPHGIDVGPGDYVRVPLGPRQITGVVWSAGGQPPAGTKLRDIVARYDVLAMSALHRQFIDWLADYYLEPAGQILRMCLRAPGAFEEPRRRIAYRSTGVTPDRLTPQRKRVLDIAGEGPAMRARELAELAGTGVSVVSGLAAARGIGGRAPAAVPSVHPAGSDGRTSRTVGKSASCRNRVAQRRRRQAVFRFVARRRHRVRQDRSLF